jgi:exodeoxyribonuclease-3
MFKLATFNVNSIRARLPIVMDWLKKVEPDVLCLQETKAEDKDFPAMSFQEAGYQVIYYGQKSYNGVAIASRQPMEALLPERPESLPAGEARLIAAVINGITVVNTYIPQGQSPDSPKFAYKLGWIRGLRELFGQNFRPDVPLIWAGDFNVAPEAIDIHDPKRLYGHVGFHPEEHKALQYVKEWGFTDAFRLHQQEGGHFTFWDYRAPNGVKRNLGWRVDHIWITAPMVSVCRSAWIDKEPRLLEKPSDHTPVIAEFDLEK